MIQAGAAGIEPAVPVLETGGLPLTDAPNLCDALWQENQGAVFTQLLYFLVSLIEAFYLLVRNVVDKLENLLQFFVLFFLSNPKLEKILKRLGTHYKICFNTDASELFGCCPHRFIDSVEIILLCAVLKNGALFGIIVRV